MAERGAKKLDVKQSGQGNAKKAIVFNLIGPLSFPLLQIQLLNIKSNHFLSKLDCNLKQITSNFRIVSNNHFTLSFRAENSFGF